ncbi:hypothetical protein VTN00DRAFT_7648 [Thermoascus crustaceus]|uniref:uncharacterized protein n=1 Tax=Thermoascus crustaceus TaxID=5088 RepID=UPI0037421782
MELKHPEQPKPDETPCKGGLCEIRVETRSVAQQSPSETAANEKQNTQSKVQTPVEEVTTDGKVNTTKKSTASTNLLAKMRIRLVAFRAAMEKPRLGAYVVKTGSDEVSSSELVPENTQNMTYTVQEQRSIQTRNLYRTRNLHKGR